jgi:hypothetical protein
MRDPVKHKALKAKMGPAVSFVLLFSPQSAIFFHSNCQAHKRQTQQYSSINHEPAVDRQVANFVELIDKKYASAPGKPSPSLDFSQKTQFWSLDSVGDFVFGQPFGFLKRDDDFNRMAEMNDLSLRMVSVLGIVPWLVRLRNVWPLSCLAPKEGDKVGFGILFG